VISPAHVIGMVQQPQRNHYEDELLDQIKTA
jgi:hypothetical protein